jgi:hypothetical protein
MRREYGIEEKKLVANKKGKFLFPPSSYNTQENMIAGVFKLQGHLDESFQKRKVEPECGQR